MELVNLMLKLLNLRACLSLIVEAVFVTVRYIATSRHVLCRRPEALLALEHLLGDQRRGHCRRPTRIESEVGDQLRELVLADAVGERAAEMAFELLLATRRDERGDRDQATIALRQARPLPDIAIDDLVGNLGELGDSAADQFAGRGGGLRHDFSPGGGRGIQPRISLEPAKSHLWEDPCASRSLAPAASAEFTAPRSPRPARKFSLSRAARIWRRCAKAGSRSKAVAAKPWFVLRWRPTTSAASARSTMSSSASSCGMSRVPANRSGRSSGRKLRSSRCRTGSMRPRG